MLSGFLILLKGLPVASAAPPSSQSSAASFTYNSESYYTLYGTAVNGASTTINAKQGGNQPVSVNVGMGTTWSDSQSGSTYTDTYSVNLGNYQFWGGPGINIYSLGFEGALIVDDYTAGEATIVGDVTVTLSIPGYSNSWSYNFNNAISNEGSGNPTNPYVEISPQFPAFSGTNIYADAILQITNVYSVNAAYYQWSVPTSGLITFSGNSGDNNQNLASLPGQSSINAIPGWTFSGVTAGSSWSLPSNSQGETFSFSNSPYSVQWSGDGHTTSQGTSESTAFTGSVPTSGQFQDVGSVPASVYSFSVSWSVTQVIQYNTLSSLPSSVDAGGTITENINWYNATGSNAYSWSNLYDPSGAINSGSTYDGTNNWPTVIHYTVSGLLVSGYGAPVNVFYIDGSQVTVSGSSASTSGTLTNSFGLTVNTENFANYAPGLVSDSVSQQKVNPNQPVTFTIQSNEAASGEPDQKVFTWNDNSGSYQTSPSTSYTSSATHSYSQPATYDPYFQIINDPVGSPISGSQQSYPSSGVAYFPSVQVVPLSFSYDPVQYSVITSSSSLSVTVTSQPGNPMQFLKLFINGILIDQQSGSGTTATMTYPLSTYFSNHPLGPLQVVWQGISQYDVQNLSIEYGSQVYPSAQSHSLVVMASTTSLDTFNLPISGAPGGSGYYQQLFTFTSSNAPGIISGLNAEASNFLITSSSGSPYYSWIQDFTPGQSLNVWSKIPNGTTSVNFQIYPQFESFLSATGYLGYGREYFNANHVFPYANSFTNLSGVGVSKGSVSAISSGMKISASSYAYINSAFKQGYFGVSFSINGTAGNNYEGFGVGNSTVGNSNEAYFTTNNLLDGYMHAQNRRDGAISDLKTAIAYPNQYSGYIYAPSLTGSYINYNFNGLDYNLSSEVPIYSQTYMQFQNVNATSYSIYNYVFYSGDATMPTYTIGSGSAFMANSTPSNVSTVMPTQEIAYNTTYSTYVYQVPLSPSTNYLTVNYNSSWFFTSQGTTPNSYIPENSLDSVLFYGLKGFTYITVALIEPSQTIGTNVPVDINLLQQGTNNTIPGNDLPFFYPYITYTPFGSSSSLQYDPGTMNFELPYGSNATIQIADYWHQIVGHAQLTIPDNAVQLDIVVNVTELQFVDNQTGATFPQVGLRFGSINGTFLDPVYVANGSNYEWYVTAQNPGNFELQLYSNSTLAKGPFQQVSVYLGAPPGSLVVNVYGYNASGIGELQNGGPAVGNPTAYLFINGVFTPLSSTFQGILGQTYHIKVSDVLGHTLLEDNVTLVNPSTTLTLNITRPSYIIGFINDENVPANSPKATQHSSIKVSNSTGPYYNFTTRVQMESMIYLAANYTYFVSTHDNISNSVYVNLTNTSEYFQFNGQNISKVIGGVLNSTNKELSVIALSQPPPAIVRGAPAEYILEVISKTNGTILNGTDLSGSQYLYQLMNQGGTIMATPVQLSVNGSEVILNFTEGTPGSYTFTVRVSFEGQSGYFSSYPLTISRLANASSGLSVSISMISKIQVNKTTDFTVSLAYIQDNSTLPLTQKETLSLLANLTAAGKDNGNFMGYMATYYISPGTVGVEMNASQTGLNWQLGVLVGKTNISGHYVSGSGNTTFSVVSYNPLVQQPNTAQQIVAYLETPDGMIALALTLGPVLVGIIWKYAPRKERSRKTEQNQAGVVMEAMGMFFGLTKQEYDVMMQQIPQETRNKIINGLTSGRIKKMKLKGAGKAARKKKGIGERIESEL